MNKGTSKRGAILELSIVFATLFFSIVVIVSFMTIVPKLDASLVSPVPVLEMGDQAHLFEIEEYEALVLLYCEDSSVATFSSRYCKEFDSFETKSFLTSGIRLDQSIVLTSQNFCNETYTFESRGNDLAVSRSGLFKKRLLLTFSNEEKANFNMRFEYYLNKEYVLTSEDCL